MGYVRGRRYTFKDVKEIVEDANYELISKKEEIVSDEGFILTKTKITVWCKNPNHKYSKPELSKFIKGARCRQCLTDSKKLNYQDIKKYFKRFNYELLSTEYKNNHASLKIKCPKGHIFYMSFSHFKDGQRCHECYDIGKNRRLKYDDVKTYIESFGYKLLSTEYINNSSKLLVQCDKGHKYKVAYSNFQQGRRCPYCNESSGEIRVREILEKYNIKFIAQYRFKDCKFKQCLPFDYYLPQYNILIEYDGQQHYDIVDCFGGLDNFINTKIRDTVKSVYCKEKSIKLIRIPYWDFNIIEYIIINELNLK